MLPKSYPIPPGVVPQDLHTAEEVAEYLKVDPKTVLNWAKSGIIPEAFRVGRTVRFSLEAVKASLNVNTVGGGRKFEAKKETGRVRRTSLSKVYDSDSGWWQTSPISSAKK